MTYCVRASIYPDSKPFQFAHALSTVADDELSRSGLARTGPWTYQVARHAYIDAAMLVLSCPTKENP